MEQSKYRIQIIDVVDRKVVYHALPGQEVEMDLIAQLVSRITNKVMEMSTVRQVRTGLFESEDAIVVTQPHVEYAVATAVTELLHELKSKVPSS